MPPPPSRLFIAQWSRAIIVNILQVGAWVMAYFVAVELVAYYQPTQDWLRMAPLWVAVGGCVGLAIRAWDTSRTLNRLDKREREEEDGF